MVKDENIGQNQDIIPIGKKSRGRPKKTLTKNFRIKKFFCPILKFQRFKHPIPIYYLLLDFVILLERLIILYK